MGWGEWFVHERVEYVSKELAYKSSIRDSISKWTPRGKKCHIRRDQNTETESLSNK